MDAPTNTTGSSLVGEIWTITKRFILPDEVVSLKVIFDNVRNYLVCAGVVGAIGDLGSIGQPEAPTTLVAFASGLVAANALQSWLIFQKWTAQIGRFLGKIGVAPRMIIEDRTCPTSAPTPSLLPDGKYPFCPQLPILI